MTWLNTSVVVVVVVLARHIFHQSVPKQGAGRRSIGLSKASQCSGCCAVGIVTSLRHLFEEELLE